MWSYGRAGLTAAALTVVAACSGGDDGSAQTTTSAVIPTVEATTTAPPEPPSTSTTTTTTTTTGTTEPPPTTAESTSTTTEVPDPTTTVPVSTTLPEGVPPRLTFPDDPDKQAVVDAVYAYLDSLSHVSAAPSDQTLREEVGRLIADPLAPRVFSFLDDLVERNERVIPNPAMPWYAQIVPPTVEVLEKAATVDACILDTDIRVAVGAGSGGADRVLDDGIVSSFQTFLLVRGGAGWQIREISEFGRFEGENQCV